MSDDIVTRARELGKLLQAEGQPASIIIGSLADEIERLRSAAPTQDAYDAACKALWDHRVRADTMTALVRDLAMAVDNVLHMDLSGAPFIFATSEETQRLLVAVLKFRDMSDDLSLARVASVSSDIDADRARLLHWQQCYNSLWEVKLAFEKEHNLALAALVRAETAERQLTEAVKLLAAIKGRYLNGYRYEIEKRLDDFFAQQEPNDA